MSEQKITIKELIQDIDFRLSHLEDITADNRKVMIKLVEQGNTIVKFLKQFEVQDVTESELGLPELPFSSENDDVDEEERVGRIQSIKEAIDDYMDKHDQLKEFEKELKKNKDKLTPGQMGES
jgi:hypothetical protein